MEWSGRQETVRVEPWGPDAVRVRARLGGPVLDGLPGALLPGHQERLLSAARAATPNTALVLVSAYPYAVDPAPLRAMLWTAHGG
ncbi:family 31 glucosidase, partial [Streptomyces spiralis]